MREDAEMQDGWASEQEEWLEAIDDVLNNRGEAETRELLLKLQAHLSHRGLVLTDAALNTPYKNTIDVREHKVTHREQEVELTAREFDLLVHFALHPGQVFRRSELLDQVWGYGHEGYEHTVNSHINRLRAKLEDERNSPSPIVTVWGVGYKFAAEG